MRHFTAQRVAVKELSDLNCFIVILEEKADESGARLELQRAIVFDAEDRRLGQDTYCICTEDGATFYGGIQSWTLNAGTLEVRLTADAAEALGVEAGFVLTFPAAQEHELKEGLERILL